ncbi:hypothetical protein N431DRAFT_439071 [Stipitochalara longipes BDJ]|nr:hypothetical protein N431DRAFT_439071 [Stipitochalara longipes BDJ]
MVDPGYFRPDYVRLPKLTFGVELELDFAVPRDVYADWLATQPSIPNNETSQDPPGDTSQSRAALIQRAAELRAEIAYYREQAGAESSPTKQAVARNALQQGIADSEALRTEIAAQNGGSPTASNGSQGEQFSQSQPVQPSNPVQAPQTSPSQSGQGPEPSPTSTDSQDETLRDNLIQYLRAYLNRQVPHSPAQPALYGQIAFAEPKTAPPTNWHLTYDESLYPSRADFAKQLGEELPTVKKIYRCVGAELVSPILTWHEEENWVPMLRQLERDLRWDAEKGHGVWFTKQEHLHVHFGMLGAEWDLDVAKTVLVLYGLFENEIERWVRVDLRNSSFCTSLRLGMEADRVGRAGDGTQTLKKGARYNPREFAERIWAVPGWEELKSEISGSGIGEGLGLADQAEVDWSSDGCFMARGWTAVGISMARGNKPLTLEFRQHQGTTEALVISWWVKFLGSLIRYASFLCREMKLELKDGPLHPTEAGFLESLLEQNKSILDLLAFDEEGKKHFQRLAEIHRDDAFDEKRDLDRLVIQDRIRRTKLHPNNNPTGERMDAKIKNSNWYKATIRKNPKLNVIPPAEIEWYLWPEDPAAVLETLISLVPGSNQRSAMQWVSTNASARELMNRDRTGRILLWFRINDDQKKRFAERLPEPEAQQPGGSDVEMEMF